MAGQGKIGIANGVMGLYDASGKIVFKGQEIKLNNPNNPLEKEYFCFRRQKRSRTPS